MRPVLIFLLGLAFFVSNPIQAEEQPTPEEQPQILALPIMVQCGSAEFIDTVMSNYNEVPFATATGTWTLPDGSPLTGGVEVYVNPETRTFSVLIVPNPEVKCVVISGNSFGPSFNEVAPKKKSNAEKKQETLVDRSDFFSDHI